MHKTKYILLLGTCLVLGLSLAACQPQTETLDLGDSTSIPTQPTSTPSTRTRQTMSKTLQDFTPNSANQATIVTDKGRIVIELYRERAPLTTANFIDLAASGFYDQIKFHRIEPGFVVQFGDPLTKDDAQRPLWGTGGPGYTIADEFHPELSHDSAGIVSMANAGPNTGGSQIFITLDATTFLDGKHAVFGKVIEGMDVVETLSVGDAITTIEIE